ncbi:MAG: peptide-methionine (S)-S-oxide reductase MsrA [Verrucomicrobiota bacterium]
MHTSVDIERATFGAGCFWRIEAVFRQIKGVLSTTVGYSGGDLPHPTYLDVCTDTTGHAEVVLVEYKPARVGYGELLEVFWNCHDPTSLNRQGDEIGSQYRSIIYFHTEAQELAAFESKSQLEQSGRYRAGIVTEILPATIFYRAEEHHQQYLEKRRMGEINIWDWSPQPDRRILDW